MIAELVLTLAVLAKLVLLLIVLAWPPAVLIVLVYPLLELSTHSTVYPLLVLVFPLVVPVCPFVCPFVALACPLVVLVCLSVRSICLFNCNICNTMYHSLYNCSSSCYRKSWVLRVKTEKFSYIPVKSAKCLFTNIQQQ